MVARRPNQSWEEAWDEYGREDIIEEDWQEPRESLRCEADYDGGVCQAPLMTLQGKRVYEGDEWTEDLICTQAHRHEG